MCHSFQQLVLKRGDITEKGHILLETVCRTDGTCSRCRLENLGVERNLVCNQLEASNHNLVC